MPCYHPLSGYRSRELTDKGKRKIVFNLSQGYRDMPVQLACGQCIGCRLERSRQWAIRMTHEASLHEKNCFITLTYAPEHLPPGGTLVVKDFQNFMKRLRKAYPNEKIRFFHCGEYGEKLSRPHYHAILFGFDFKDRKYKKSHNGFKYYTSESLKKIWGKGHILTCDVSFETCAYVARYITKKITGEKALLHYNEIDACTGELLSEKIPEYTTMSRRPGIAKKWFDLYKNDVFPSDEVILRGKKLKPPRYYDTQFEILSPIDMLRVKAKRIAKAILSKEESSFIRLQTREEIQLLKFKQLKRGYEDET